MKFREDINGLRAVAVLPIVLYHAGMSNMSGGFVGVDIFFVISGYLISKIIIDELSIESFHLMEFYKRRIIRIFPALIFMLSTLLIVSFFLSLPSEIESLNATVIAATLSVSNIYFWFETNYFSPAAELQPLLHTWSLGVEEQFYLIFPLLLILVKKHFNQNYIRFLIAIIAISLVFSWYLSVNHTAAGFYLLPSRAWELAMGSLVALNYFPKIKSTVLINTLFVIGVLLLFLGFFYTEPHWHFPFPWALVPCFGTFILLAYGNKTSLSKVLSIKPMQFIGKISYSLYLWHWPIITLYRIETGIELDLAETLMLVIASILVATISYEFIEKVFLRKYRSSNSPKKIVLSGLLSLVAFCLIISYVSRNIESFRETPEAVQAIDLFNKYRQTTDYLYQFRTGSPCFRGFSHSNIAFDTEMCVKSNPDVRNIVVLGDSHAAQFWRAIELKHSEANVMQATASGCRPLLAGTGASFCREVVDYVLGPMLDNKGFDTIVLSARWEKHEIELLQKTVSYLYDKGVKVFVIGNTVEYYGEFPSLLARSIRNNSTDSIDKHRVLSKEKMDIEIKAVTENGGGHFISLFENECPYGRCKLITDEGHPFHFDYGHLTLSAAKWHVSLMPDL